VARRRLKLELTPEDADRIYGAQWAAEWKRDNQRQGTRGPASKRWAEIKAGLENFVPEVKEGNQNALKTRAHPFARYIAAVHRRIHELWGFGFIEDLDRLPATDEFNDMSRLTKLEIVITRQGTIDKVGIVKPSGYLPFDVAAMDAVLSAGPFEAPPAVILSPNGKVYLHWRFARDHRQCGTFGVDAFILERAPGAPADRVKPATPGERAGEHLGRRPAPSPPERPAAPRPAEARPPASPMDADALAVAYAFVSAFQRGDAARIAAVADLPFSASGVVVARTPAELARMMTALVAETEQRRLERISGALTAAGLRSQLGSLPKGVRAGGAERFVVVRMDGADLVLILAPDHRGTMRLRGIAR
jgi:TonB family protein